MLAAICISPLLATAQETEPTTEERITTLEKKVAWLDYRVRSFAAERVSGDRDEVLEAIGPETFALP